MYLEIIIIIIIIIIIQNTFFNNNDKLSCVRKILYIHIHIPTSVYTSTDYSTLLSHVPLGVSEDV